MDEQQGHQEHDNEQHHEEMDEQQGHQEQYNEQRDEEQRDEEIHDLKLYQQLHLYTLIL